MFSGVKLSIRSVNLLLRFSKLLVLKNSSLINLFQFACSLQYDLAHKFSRFFACGWEGHVSFSQFLVF